MLRGLFLVALLEAGSCAELKQSAQYVRTGLAALSEGLEKISAPGSARQIAINALMKSVQGSERLEPDQIDTLTQVEGLLNQVLLSMRNYTIENQAELGLITGEVATCNNIGFHAELYVRSDQSIKAGIHQQCRTEEKVLFDDDATKCGALSSFLSTLAQPNCVRPTASKANIPEWTTFLQTGLQWFETNEETYVVKRDPCQNATEALEEKNTECDQDQAAYETRFCEWKAALEDRCSGMSTCYAEKTELHTNRTNRIMPLSATRVKEAGLVQHVLCLIAKLKSEETITDFATDCPVPNDAALTEYANTEVTAPAADPCDVSVVAVHPGSATWQAQAYDPWMPVGLHADVSDACQ